MLAPPLESWRPLLGEILDPPLVAASKGYDNVVQKLVEAGADVNVPPSLRDWTFLMESCLKGNVKCTELLINEGADVNATNKYGHTELPSELIRYLMYYVQLD